MGLILPNNRRAIIPLVGAPGVHLTNSSLKQNLTNADLQVTTLLKLVDKLEPDGIFPIMDLTVEAEALGMEIEFPENANPSVRVHNCQTLADLEAIKSRTGGRVDRQSLYLNVVSQLAKRLNIVKGAYVIGPYTLAGELMGVETMIMTLLENPELARQFIEFTYTVVNRYAKELFDAGADTIAVLEPSAVMLSPDLFEEYPGTYFKRLADDLQKPLILHICGNTTHLIPKFPFTNAAGLSLDSVVNFAAAAKKIPQDMVLIGNLDPVRVFMELNPEEVKEATLEFLTQMAGVPNFILSSGCDLPLETPMENITAFMDSAKEYNDASIIKSA